MPRNALSAPHLASLPFRLSPLAVLLASVSMFGSTAVYAQTVEELKAALEKSNAENARLRQQLEAIQPTTVAPTATAAADPVQKTEPEKSEQPTKLKGVVVRARNTNRLAGVQDVPQSIVAVSGEELQRLGGDTMRDVIKRVSNISRQDRSNARSSDLSLRGIGRKGNSEAQDPNTLVTVDGISYGYSGLSAWDFVDINSIEVLRGPTGTAGGKNASVGAVNITTKRPSFTPSTDISLRVGDHDSVIGTAAIGGPVIDDLLAWRGTFYVDKQEGEFGNAYDSGDNTYTDRNKISAKVQFLLTPSDDFSALVSADLQPNTYENDNGLNFFHPTVPYYDNGTSTDTLQTDASKRLARRWFGQQQDYRYDNNYINWHNGTQNQDNQRALLTGLRGTSAQLDWRVGTHTLTSITGYRKLYFDARNDEGTPFDISTQGGGGMDYRQFSQELKLSSDIGGTVDYVTGLYYMRNRNAVDSKTGWGADAGAWFATPQQYASLDATGAGRYLLQNSLNGLRKNGTAVNENSSPAIFGQLNWHVSEPLTLSTGLRITREHRTASNFAKIISNGYGAELNDGLFNTTTGGELGTGTGVGGNGVAVSTATQLAAANVVAQKYFGVDYSALTNAQKQQVAYARALRKSQLGLLYAKRDAEDFEKTQYTYFVSPSYKITDNVTGYFTYQHGEKAAAAQVINNFSATTKPETTDNIEIGFKSSLLDRTLTLNADVYVSRIKDYEQQAYVVDEYTTALNRGNNDPTIAYIALTGNAPKVKAKGVEFDAFYSGIEHVTLRVSAAYNDARYDVFRNAPAAPEDAWTRNPDGTPASPPAYQDLSGKTLPGAAKWTGNIGGDYRIPVFGNKEFHADFNYYLTSKYNNDPTTYSRYGWVSGYEIADIGIGIGRQDQTWDATFLVKNVFDVQAKSYGFSNGILDTTPRWIGVLFTSKL